MTNVEKRQSEINEETFKTHVTSQDKPKEQNPERY